jgi:type III secretion protein U
MMTKDEVKREYKESEGDPIVKGQRRALAQELAMSDGRKQVQTASAVIVNPTHLAVAIRYTKGDTPLPIVTAKGRERVAVDMRAEAERAGVPVFRNVPLARHLYAATEPGDYVPDAVFEAVAEVLAWVARHEATLYRGTLGHGAIDMERGDHRADLDARRR